MAHTHNVGTSAAANARRLALTLGLVLLYMGVEVAGGLVTRSLALLADAGHMLSDAGALGLALLAMRFAQRPASGQKTFGSYRAEILAALVDGATLAAIALFIVVEAIGRFRQPPDVQGPLMLAVACGGLAMNVAGLKILGDGHERNLNMQGARLHVLTDTLGSVQAIVAAGLIWALGWNWVDPVASILIALLVVYSSWSLLKQSVAVLMERAPSHINVDDVRTALLSLSEVTRVDDLHVWTITSGFVALSAHLTCEGAGDRDAILGAASALLAERFDIRHTTIQVDSDVAVTEVAHRPPR